MILKDAIEEIKTRVKPYEHVDMQQGTFTNTLKAIEYGFAKPKTIEAFMCKFGYKPVKSEQQWEKQ